MNAFVGRTSAPTEAELAAALGSAKQAWDDVLSAVAEVAQAEVREWKSYSVKAGWALRVCRKKRTIVWLSPAAESFEVLFILGEKAVQAARVAKLPAAVQRALEAAPKYPEGTGLRLQVTSSRSVPALKQLAAIKAAN